MGRALQELGVGLIRARSPQAKGRVGRSFGTARDRWVEELRLAGAATCEQANAVLDRLLPAHDRSFGKTPRGAADAHRPLGPGHDLAAILSVQTARTVGNDYVVRFANRHYQLLPPALPGLRGGRVVIEERLDGSMRARFGEAYLSYREVGAAAAGAAGDPPGRQREEGRNRKGHKPAADHPWRNSHRPRKPQD